MERREIRTNTPLMCFALTVGPVPVTALVNMLRLIVNPGTGNAWEIPLQAGVASLGRGPENNFVIEHSSVSSTHCQLTISDAGVVIKDLGSINGTFVNDEMVEEVLLVDGQAVRLGDVVIRFESDLIPRARPVPGVVLQPQTTTATTDAATVAAVCKFHPHEPATHRCPKCRRTFCDLCVSHRQGRYFCRACSVECSRVREAAVPVVAHISFFNRSCSAFTYPLKGDGLYLLVGGGAFFLVLALAEKLVGFLGPYGGVLALILAVFGAGYAFCYAKSIITSTANGEDMPPDWPEVNEWQEDIVEPFGQMVGLLAFTFGPAAILRWWRPGSETFAHDIILVVTILGALLAPMGMLALAMFDSIAALNPLLLVKSILRIPLLYLATAGVFEILTLTCLQAGSTVGLFIPIPILPGLISVLFNLYLTLAGMRLLGLLYRSNADKLGWFARG